MEEDKYERFIISKNNIILEVNKDFLNPIGYTEIELVGKTLAEAGKLLRTDSQVDLEELKKDTRIFIFTKDLVAIEGTISCKIMGNGDRKVFSFKKDPLQNANQSFNLANQMGVSRQALEQRNEDLETIIDNISDEIIIFDKDFNIEISSKRIEENITLNHPYLKSLSNMDDFEKIALIFDEDNQLIPYEKWPVNRVAKGENISNLFMKIITPNKISYREASGYSTYDRGGDFSRGILILKDIGDRIEKEETRLIKMQKELLSKVVESMELEYVRCTYPDLKIISLNDKAIDKLKKINEGIKSESCAIGKHCFELYPLDVETKIKNLEYHLIGKGSNSYLDYQNYIVDGEERFFQTMNEPIFGLDNKIVEVIFITTDITEQVQEKNRMEDTLQMQNQMFATISHELKTPLNVVFSAAQLIERNLQGEKDNIDKEDVFKKINIIKQNCYRFTKLINNIIDLSRMESGFYRLRYSNVNIVEIVEDIIDSVRSYVKSSGLRITFDTEVEEKIMAVDVDKMERVILNLISNAVKFSPKGETIYIKIEDKGDYVLVIVRDCGWGIEAKYLDTIFDRYKKVDNSLYKNAEGSGLGLSLVEMIVKSVGGKISVESELGKGSAFTMKIPVNILDESEVIESMKCSGNRKQQLNIEFSDL